MYWVLILLLFFTPQGFAADSNAADQWFQEFVHLQDTYQSLENLVNSSLQDYQQAVVEGTVKHPFEKNFWNGGERKVVVDWAHIPYGTQKKQYDHTATIWEKSADMEWRRMAEVNWDSTKTGALPGPEASLFKNPFFKIESDEVTEAPYHYYRGRAQFNNIEPNTAQRGYAEFFQDLQKGTMKISASTVQGPGDLTLDQIKQHNAQAIFGLNSYIFLTVDKNHFCKNPQGMWVGSNSREWDDFCAPLFDNPQWNGFSYNLLPKGPLLEN